MLNKKIISFQVLTKKIINLKKLNKTIVHCHGVFDLLHLGHIRHFQEAKTYGDILIITITPEFPVYCNEVGGITPNLA